MEEWRREREAKSERSASTEAVGKHSGDDEEVAVWEWTAVDGRRCARASGGEGTAEGGAGTRVGTGKGGEKPVQRGRTIAGAAGCGAGALEAAGKCGWARRKLAGVAYDQGTACEGGGTEVEVTENAKMRCGAGGISKEAAGGQPGRREAGNGCGWA